MRLPKTTASATEYTSSSRRGATGQLSRPSILSTSWNRERYQTFHSSNEMSIVFVAAEDGLHVVGGRDDRLDEVVHVDC